MFCSSNGKSLIIKLIFDIFEKFANEIEMVVMFDLTNL